LFVQKYCPSCAPVFMKTKNFVQENVKNCTLISHFAIASSGGFRGGRAGSGPLFGQWTDAIMLANAKFDRSTVKHRTENIQNDCHQWLSGSFSAVYQIRFRPGLCPGPNWGSLQRSPDPLAGLRAKGPYF